MKAGRGAEGERRGRTVVAGCNLLGFDASSHGSAQLLCLPAATFGHLAAMFHEAHASAVMPASRAAPGATGLLATRASPHRPSPGRTNKTSLRMPPWPKHTPQGRQLPHSETASLLPGVFRRSARCWGGSTSVQARNRAKHAIHRPRRTAAWCDASASIGPCGMCCPCLCEQQRFVLLVLPGDGR